jgi:hypothetical protein
VCTDARREARTTLWRRTKDGRVVSSWIDLQLEEMAAHWNARAEEKGGALERVGRERVGSAQEHAGRERVGRAQERARRDKVGHAQERAHREAEKKLDKNVDELNNELLDEPVTTGKSELDERSWKTPEVDGHGVDANETRPEAGTAPPSGARASQPELTPCASARSAAAVLGRCCSPEDIEEVDDEDEVFSGWSWRLWDGGALFKKKATHRFPLVN